MISVRSLPKICVALGVPEPAQLEKIAVATCDHGDSFLELRLDMLGDPTAGVRVIPKILRRHPDAIILATCRRRQNGGEFRGSIARQMAVLAAAVDAGAALVDVELETVESTPAALESFQGKALRVLSYHNFDRTPALKVVVRRLRKFPAEIYKIATHASRQSDNLKLLALLTEDAPLVLLGMSEAGTTTRLLAPSKGAVFTFAAPDAIANQVGKAGKALSAAPTAPGQFTASTLRQLYRVQRRSRDTAIYGLIAKPIGHSMSPALHNRAFKTKRIDAIYLPFLVEPGHIRDFFKCVAELPIAGLSVTIPHKQKVMRYLDYVDPLACGIGAVNTIYRKRGKLCGTNTDAIGVTAPLAKKLKLNRSRVLVVGNGGAARAAVFALKDQGSEVVVTGRNPERVKRLARAAGVSAIEFAKLDGDYFDVLIQTTPVGLYPKPDGNLFPRRIPADVVFDMVYNPLETALLKHAKEEGRTVISGLEMFVEQAAAQFQIWTGTEAPRTVMRNAVLERLQ
jgi:3-dehydroquinate dehydratase/shikimate dehydrogenase